jgi:hypothetical protein
MCVKDDQMRLYHARNEYGWWHDDNNGGATVAAKKDICFAGIPIFAKSGLFAFDHGPLIVVDLRLISSRKRYWLLVTIMK